MRRVKNADRPALTPAQQLARRRAIRRWLVPAARFLSVGGIVFMIAGAPYIAIRSGLAGRTADFAYRYALDASVAAGLRVEDVLLEGREHTTRAQVIAAIGLQRGDPMLGFDPQILRQRVEGLPWVRTARIERLFPSTVRISITERNPVALWQKNGRFHIVDDEGAVIADSAPERYRELLIVVGDGAPKHVPELVVMLAAEPAMRKRITAAVWVGDRRWNLRFDDRTDVRLPEHDAPVAWAKLARLEREFGILGRDVDAIDLRLPDRLVVRTRGERGTAKPQGKST